MFSHICACASFPVEQLTCLYAFGMCCASAGRFCAGLVTSSRMCTACHVHARPHTQAALARVPAHRRQLVRPPSQHQSPLPPRADPLTPPWDAPPAGMGAADSAACPSAATREACVPPSYCAFDVCRAERASLRFSLNPAVAVPLLLAGVRRLHRAIVAHPPADALSAAGCWGDGCGWGCGCGCLREGDEPGAPSTAEIVAIRRRARGSSMPQGARDEGREMSAGDGQSQGSSVGHPTTGSAGGWQCCGIPPCAVAQVRQLLC
jgi:hypothetical protein